MLASGIGTSEIVAYGRIVINVATPSGPGIMTPGAVYCPDFMINIVSGSILEDKGVFFDIEHRRMRRGGKTLFFVTYNGDHYLAEDNTESSQNLAAATTDKPAVFAAVKSGTAVNWHQLLAHAGSDAIQHLAGAAEGVKIEENTKVPPTNMCETCALSKARRIVSRSPAKLEAFDKP